MGRSKTGGRQAGFGRALAAAALALICGVPPAAAQTPAAYTEALPPLLPRDREIALARSAAPPEVSAEATVLVLVRGVGYVEAVRGTNGVTCYVSRSRPGAIEPHCFDEEGSATILAMELRRAELRERGRDAETIEADVAAGLREGRFRLPRRPAVSYMLSSAQRLISDDGRDVGRWKPHLMIYYPWLSAEQLGLPDAPVAGTFVVDDGKPVSNILIVLREFVDPADGQAGPAR